MMKRSLCRYITNGNVLSYEKDKVHKGKLYAPVESNTSDGTEK